MATTTEWQLHERAARKDTTMSENLNNLFSTKETEATTSTRSLAGTAQLTTLANSLTATCIQTIEANIDYYRKALAESKTSHDAMDALISSIIVLKDVDTEFLTKLEEATLDSMLKSQQSKRSRSKGKIMTMENYRSMMTAAFAENLIRVATGSSKNATGARRLAGQVTYTAEQLKELAADQEKLRKEIRNIQSKKSIAKSKEGFSETSDSWLELLKAEEQLKSIRTDGSSVKTVLVDTTKDRLTQLFEMVKDINTMRAADAKALLEEIKQLTMANVENAAEDISQTVQDVVDAAQSVV